MPEGPPTVSGTSAAGRHLWSIVRTGRWTCRYRLQLAATKLHSTPARETATGVLFGAIAADTMRQAPS